jgi:hypothetical protein
LLLGCLSDTTWGGINVSDRLKYHDNDLPADSESRMFANQTSICYLVHTELAAEILWVSDHIDHLKAKLATLNYDTLHELLEVIASEVVAHLIASDLGIQYDEPLNVLRDEAAWECGVMMDNTPDFIKKVRFMHTALRIVGLN